MSRLRTSLILGSGLDSHRRLDEREQDGKSSAVSQRTDIENLQEGDLVRRPEFRSPFPDPDAPR